jgi:hypothetical protein
MQCTDASLRAVLPAHTVGLLDCLTHVASRPFGLTLLRIPREHIRGIRSQCHSIAEAPRHTLAQRLHTRGVVSFLTELNVQAET